MFHVSVFPEKSLNIALSSHFLITMHEIDTAAEVYLEPFQTLPLRFLQKQLTAFGSLTQLKAPP